MNYTKPPTHDLITAHSMRSRGYGPLQIGQHLGYSDRTIARWLKAPPPPIPAVIGHWIDDAACTTADPEIFFPDRREDDGIQAKQICAQCPVRNPCLLHALAHNEHGIWGATNDHQRQQLKQRPCPMTELCGAGHLRYPTFRCTKPAGHDRKHGYAGSFWDDYDATEQPMTYGINYSLLSGNIYIGRINKSGHTWITKEEHSISAALAVAEWVQRQHNGQVDLTTKTGDGPTYRITVEKIE